MPAHNTLRTFVLLLLTALPVLAAPREKLRLRHVPLELPAAPAAVVSTDLDGDGRRDLVVALAYTRWDQIGIEESVEMKEFEAGREDLQLEGMVEVLTIVPALLDRRELLVFLAGEDGGYQAAGPALPLDQSILSIAAGPPGHAVIALTDAGVATLRPVADSGEGPRWRFEPLLEDRPVLAGTGAFLADLGLVQDLDGDGKKDMLLPARRNAAVYLTGDEGALNPGDRLPLPQEERRSGGRVRHYPLAEVRDVDGDGKPEVLMPDRRRGFSDFHVLRNLGEGRFGEPVAPLEAPPKERPAILQPEEGAGRRNVVFFGDLDGDGRAEYVVQQEPKELEDAGLRAEMRQAKRPEFRYRLHHMRPDFTPEPEPYQEFVAEGYSAASGSDEEEGDAEEPPALPGGFRDLDGDGRLDLVTVTLDFSLFQAVKVLTVQRIGIGLDFHVWCQQQDGSFRRRQDLDLSGKFNLDLDNLRIGQLSQFAGDFDGDGRADFVQMGRGKRVTIHRGQAGCGYPAAPDLTLELAQEPRDLGLVQVRDFDGDALTDLLVIQPQKVDEPGVTPPVRLDLYLSAATP